MTLAADHIVERSAVISTDGTYRYLLRRAWGAGEHVTFVMLNPSTADGVSDDPTIRRCIGFSRYWGYDAVEVVNLYAYRATDPKDLVDRLKGGYVSIVGPKNDEYLQSAAERADVLVAAWGAHPITPARVAEVTRLLGPDRFVSLGTTKDGHPRHPLYVKSATEIRAWPERSTDV